MSKKQSGASSVGGALGSASWFWVMSPIFFSWVLALACLGIVGLIAAIALKDD